MAQCRHLKCREHVGRVSAGVAFYTQNRENVKKCDINVQILQKMRHLRHLCDHFPTLFATPVLYCIPTLIGHFQLLRHQNLFFVSSAIKKKIYLIAVAKRNYVRNKARQGELSDDRRTVLG